MVKIRLMLFERDDSKRNQSVYFPDGVIFESETDAKNFCIKFTKFKKVVNSKPPAPYVVVDIGGETLNSYFIK
jgi:hypothetical protein